MLSYTSCQHTHTFCSQNLRLSINGFDVRSRILCGGIGGCRHRDDRDQLETQVTPDSSPGSAAYMCHKMRSALVQIMACRLFDVEPLSKPMLGYCQLDPSEHTYVTFWSKFETFYSSKCIWKCCLRNGGHFVQGDNERPIAESNFYFHFNSCMN